MDVGLGKRFDDKPATVNLADVIVTVEIGKRSTVDQFNSEMLISEDFTKYTLILQACKDICNEVENEVEVEKFLNWFKGIYQMNRELLQCSVEEYILRKCFQWLYKISFCPNY